MAVARRQRRRKLAAILFADVVGYSHLVAKDEASALARVDALRRRLIDPRVAAHGGRPFAALGDGFLADFPSAVEAVTCAVEIQRVLHVGRPRGGNARDPPWQGLALRIGINLGDVVAEADGSIYGDGVNIAARLQALAEPGGVLVSGAVHGQLVGRLALPFDDCGERALKNIPHEVRLFALPPLAVAALPDEVWEPAAEPGTWPSRRMVLLTATLPFAVVLASGLGWWASIRQPHPTPLPSEVRLLSTQAAIATSPLGPMPAQRLSMVVLPFVNLGGDPGQDHVAAGVTDDLTTAVGRISHALVIGRGTASAYRGRAVDARQVGRELGVRYVVEGSARRTGDRLRVSAQLVDAASGTQLWAEIFDEPFGELSALTGAIASQIAVALNYPLVVAEAARGAAERPGNPDALDLMLRGRALHNAVGTFETYGEARRLFERAVELDPGSAQAHAMLAHILTGLWSIGWPEDREGLLRRAEEHAERALEIDPLTARAHYARGVVQEARRQFELAFAAYDHAATLNPHFVFIHARRGWLFIFTDRPEAAIAEFRRAISISPREPGIGGWHNGLAAASLMLGRDEEAVGHAQRAIAANPSFHSPHLLLAAGLALLGRDEEARTALGSYLRLRPAETAASLRRYGRERSGYPLYVAMCDRMADTLRGVGLPEGDTNGRVD